MRTKTALLWTWMLACGGGDSGSGSFGTTATTAPPLTASGGGTDASSSGALPTTAGDSASGGSTGEGASSSSSSSTTTTTTTTTGAGSTGSPDGGCTRVDFLFVVDNSQTMEDEQAALAAAFPQFIDTIETELTTATDYHIMVVDTDGETRCTELECSGNNTHETCNDYACDKTNFKACDTVFGAGVVHPAGVHASNALCKPYGTPRYLTQDDPQLAERFACMAKVGTAGAPNERPMDAIVEALGAGLNQQGACNEGFLRDDAILVVTFFSDDPNIEDLKTPAQAHAAVLAAKGGDLSKVSVLGLIPMQPDCTPGQKPLAGAHWQEFIELFGPERGKAVPICAADFNQFFADAVAIIEESCSLQPPV